MHKAKQNHGSAVKASVTSHIRVLVVEKANLADMYRQVFEKHGWEVTTATTEIDALRLIELEHFDAAVMGEHLELKGSASHLVIPAFRAANPKSPMFMLSATEGERQMDAGGKDHCYSTPKGSGEVQKIVGVMREYYPTA
ncbi:MAG: hypothetical protein RIT04_335 [Candidatus Parcubacteria bacterium]|jgi:DNA-binding NtrC family response regulator